MHTCFFFFRSGPVAHKLHRKKYVHRIDRSIQIICAYFYSNKAIMLHMRFLVALAITILVVYPYSAASQITSLCSKKVTLGVNQSKKVCCNAVLRVNSIQDSRCPVNVQCIWEGQARVKLTLSRNAVSSSVELIIGAQAQPNALIALGIYTYSVTLQDVVPYPGTSNTPPKAVITIGCP